MPKSPRTFLALLALAGAVGLAAGQVARRAPAFAPPGESERVLSDAEVLAAARLDPADAGALLGYFRLRTLTENDRAKIDAIIARLGRDDFDERLAAQAELERLGPAAVTALRAAAAAAAPPAGLAGPGGAPPDPEVAYRAGLVLSRLDKIPHAQTALAAARRLAAMPPAPGTCGAVLDYLPLADSWQVADALRRCLATHAVVAAPGAAPAVEPAVLAAALGADPAKRLRRDPGGAGARPRPDARLDPRPRRVPAPARLGPRAPGGRRQVPGGVRAVRPGARPRRRPGADRATARIAPAGVAGRGLPAPGRGDRTRQAGRQAPRAGPGRLGEVVGRRGRRGPTWARSRTPPAPPGGCS